MWGALSTLAIGYRGNRWSATSNGALTTTLTDASLPKAFPLRLNTSDWGKLIPELQAKYPDRPMQVSGLIACLLVEHWRSVA